jgi:hypothetical protein
VLSRLSVEAMTTDQLTPEQKAISGLTPGFFDSNGWGFGVWDGGLGTSWASNPAKKWLESR